MRRSQKSSTVSGRILARAGARVKGRIVGHNVKLSDLACAAGISRPSLTAYIQGRAVRPEIRVRIWRAYKGLSGERVPFAEFWKPLFENEAA